MKDQTTLSHIKNNYQNKNNIITSSMGQEKNTTKELLKSWGFKMAAQLNASLGDLRNSMDKIMTSYLAEIKDKEMLQRDDIKSNMEDFTSQTINKEKDFSNADVVVIGIQPKKDDLYEQEKLIHFWHKWVKSMDFNQVVCIPSASKTQVVQRMKRLFL